MNDRILILNDRHPSGWSWYDFDDIEIVQSEINKTGYYETDWCVEKAEVSIGTGVKLFYMGHWNEGIFALGEIVGIKDKKNIKIQIKNIVNPKKEIILGRKIFEKIIGKELFERQQSAIDDNEITKINKNAHEDINREINKFFDSKKGYQNE